MLHFFLSASSEEPCYQLCHTKAAGKKLSKHWKKEEGNNNFIINLHWATQKATPTVNYWSSWSKYTAQESSRVLCSPSLSPTFGSYLPLQAQAVFGSVNQFWGSWTVWLTALCSEAHQLWNGFFDGTAGCWNSKQRVINDVVVALAPGNLREELAASGI